MSSDVKNLLRLLSKLSVANEETMSIFPRYVPKLVSIPINANKRFLSTKNSLDTISINF